MTKESCITLLIALTGFLAMGVIVVSIVFIEETREIIAEYETVSSTYKFNRFNDCRHYCPEEGILIKKNIEDKHKGLRDTTDRTRYVPFRISNVPGFCKNNSYSALKENEALAYGPIYCYQNKAKVQSALIRANPVMPGSSKGFFSFYPDGPDYSEVSTYAKGESFLKDLESQLRGVPFSWIPISITLIVFGMLQFFSNVGIYAISFVTPEKVTKPLKGYATVKWAVGTFGLIFAIIFIIGMVRGVNVGCPGQLHKSKFGFDTNSCKVNKTHGQLLMGIVGTNMVISIIGILVLHFS